MAGPYFLSLCLVSLSLVFLLMSGLVSGLGWLATPWLFLVLLLADWLVSSWLCLETNAESMAGKLKMYPGRHCMLLRLCMCNEILLGMRACGGS
ncbi:hypothetical protein J3E68DRAFT_400772 [Trichoderma sp. SZMC 28012]